MKKELEGVKIGYCLTGSFCTFSKTVPQIKRLVEMGADVTPIMSQNAYSWDTKFGPAEKWKKEIKEITGKDEIIHTVVGAEPIGPGGTQDIIVVAPTTGNTITALANGLTNGPVPMACKAQWRNNKPVVIAISTNDGLGACGKNISKLHDKELTYIVPYGQDNPHNKEDSLVAHFEYIPDTIISALDGRQFQPVLIPHVY